MDYGKTTLVRALDALAALPGSDLALVVGWTVLAGFVCAGLWRYLCAPCLGALVAGWRRRRRRDRFSNMRPPFDPLPNHPNCRCMATPIRENDHE